uniref:Large ribosomal subunit protein bL20c n=1 Tax=Ctenolophon englerianus TaxID=125022 RepID=A0A7D5A802_9ROSI|nr:ribosomal protein L20 [Ctenolophon englerianus]QKT26960.1 ribosomal protein L20 [Ctenolophon englerianus]
MFLFDTQYQYNFLFRGEMPRKKKEKIVGWKVIVAKAVGIIILYIGRICFGIIEKGKKITERKGNQLVIHQSFVYSMTRIRRGYIARKRRTKMSLFTSSFCGAHSKLTRTIMQQKMKALVSAHRDRDRQKRNFRHLWITRINAVIRENKASYSYSRLINNLYKKQLLLNRKILAQIAILNGNCLYMISNDIIK